MRVRSLAVVLLLMLMLASARAESRRDCGTHQWRTLIEGAAVQFQIPPQWIHAVIRAESAGCATTNGLPTVSSAGAMGLMQLMPQTWTMLRDRLHLGDDPHDLRDNIVAGSAYLAELYQRYGLPGALAAYHAGPRRYDEYLSGARALPLATLEYLARVQRWLGAPSDRFDIVTARGGAPDRAIFVRMRRRGDDNGQAAEELAGRTVFARLKRAGSAEERARSAQADVQPQ